MFYRWVQLPGSTRRKGIFTEYLEFTGIEWETFTRYVSTRWLCLEKCCAKELKKFRALKSMFLSRGDKDLIDRGTGDERKVLVLDIHAYVRFMKTT